jgi:uncharacterized protein (TIRG00374 family)
MNKSMKTLYHMNAIIYGVSGFKKDYASAYHSTRISVQSRRRSGWRLWLNAATLTLIAVVLFVARDQLVEAWHLLSRVNIWILLLLIPVQIFGYYAAGEIFFTYLRGRGQLKKTSGWDSASMALELNFVNHVFPSGGIAGISYMVWRLNKLGVKAGQATMAQIMRYVVTAGTFFVLLTFALLFMAADGRVSNAVAMTAAVTVTGGIFLVLFASYLVGSEKRMRSFARWLAGGVNALVKKITFGKVKKNVLPIAKSVKFFLDFHEDYVVLKSQKRLLIKPIVWSFVFNLLDLALFIVAFVALGEWVNPAVLLMGYGVASLAGLVVLTPGGAGAYEAIMVGILTAGGVAASTALAGVILSRTLLMAGTLLSGYFFYQKALRKYGKPRLDRPVDLTPDDEIAAAEAEENARHAD